MRKLFYYISMTNTTPLHIGNGDNTLTDLDVIKDKEGKFFIPGTTLAGGFLHSLNEEDRELFNPIVDKNMTKQSPFFISDALVEEETIDYETRDGIALDENKITKDGNKYDYEIVPAGYHFRFRIEVFDRDENVLYEKLVDQILASIDNQDIRLGYKTSRGLGAFKVERVGFKVFNKDNYNDYFNFDSHQLDNYDLYEYEALASKYLNMKISLKQQGGLSIRAYQTKKGEADFIHIHSRNKPIIPGTSWNGLFRKQFNYYLKLLPQGIEIENVFGTDIDSEDKIKSNIYFKESTINDYEILSMVRNKINRYDNSTIKGGLYKEESCYNGTTELEITLNKRSFSSQQIEIIKNILLLIIKDLDEGFIALGGETSIGRGLFKVEKVMIDDECVCLEDTVC